MFEDQESQISSSRAGEISVAIADAVQSELSAYFMEANGAAPGSYANIIGGDSGVVRTQRCNDGVFAYIHEEEANIRGLGPIDSDVHAMQMIGELQNRFGARNVGYKSDSTIKGIANTQNNADCMNAIQSLDIANGSPVVALNLANIQTVLPQEFTDKLSTIVYQCADLSGLNTNIGNVQLMGTIAKQCVTRYTFDQNTGQIQLDADGLPMVVRDCEQPTQADIDQFCRPAQEAPERDFQISDGITMGTDWSTYFQDANTSQPLTIRCVSVPGQADECLPFDPALDPSILIECNEEPITIQQAVNPIIQNGQVVNGDMIERECGFDWYGDLIADYETRRCDVYEVDPTGNTPPVLTDEKNTIYQMYYVGAQCHTRIDNVPISCPMGNGSMYVRQRVQMTTPLALQPHNTGRGEQAYSTIAVAGTETPDVVDRVNNLNYFLSSDDLNTIADQDEFNDSILTQMANFLSTTNISCNMEGQTCKQGVLPEVTMVIVDRSASMGFTTPEDLVHKVRGDRRCKTTLYNVFNNPEASCTILDENMVANDGTQSVEDYNALMNDIKAIYQNDPMITAFVEGALSSGGTCEDVHDDLLGSLYQGSDGDGDGLRICQQGSNAPDCQDTCPGVCFYDEEAILDENGNPVTELKYQAVDYAINEVIVPEMQYGSSFIYTYFLSNNIDSRTFRVTGCKLGDGQPTPIDDNWPDCGNEEVIVNEISNVLNGIADITDTRGGGTPLYQTLEAALGHLQTEMQYRADLHNQLYPNDPKDPSDIEVAVYVMTDGEAGPHTGFINSVCGTTSDLSSFSGRFKDTYENGQVFILNLPGAVNTCADHVIDNPSNPGEKTVDHYFEFNLAGASFANVFGALQTTDIIPPSEVCDFMALSEDRYWDDSVGDGNTDGGTTYAGGCEIGEWESPPGTCTGYNGITYTEGHPYCPPWCFDMDGNPWPMGHANCDPNFGDGTCIGSDGLSYPIGHPACDDDEPCVPGFDADGNYIDCPSDDPFGDVSG